MKPPLLRMEGLTRRFGSLVAVSDLSFEVAPGEIFGFLGPNGAGKTTTIAMICGLLKPDAGRIWLDGQDLSRDGVRLRARIGVCPQSIVVWERLTCLEQLEFIGQSYGVEAREARRRGAALLDALGLAEKRSSRAGALSGGMQRRLNLALALVHDPDLLVLDEPEAGLDPQSRVLVREYIREWARSRPNRTVLFTTHNMDEAERLVDRVGIIDRGKLLVMDTPAALKRRFGQGAVLEITLRENTCSAEQVLALLGELREGARYTEGAPAGVLQIHRAGAVEVLPAVLEGLRAGGLTPAEVRIRENSLEDVFITLTGRRLRE